MTTNPFIDIAKIGKNHWWRYGLGILIVGLHLPVLFFVFLNYADQLKLPPDGVNYYANFLYRASALPVLLLVVLYLHQRPGLTVLTVRPTFRWNRMLFAFGVMLILCALPEVLIYLGEPADYYISLDWGRFVPALLFGLVFITLQALSEEALYRGYLLQASGLATRNLPATVFITILFFAAPHWNNVDGDKAVSMSFFVGFGLLLALTTLLDNGVEISVGIHTANNVFGTLIVNHPDDGFPSPSIIGSHHLTFNWTLVVATWVSYLILLWILTRKYRWNWQRLLKTGETQNSYVAASASGSEPGDNTLRSAEHRENTD